MGEDQDFESVSSFSEPFDYAPLPLEGLPEGDLWDNLQEPLFPSNAFSENDAENYEFSENYGSTTRRYLGIAQDLRLDRPLPQNPEAERALLGAMVRDNGNHTKVIPIVKAEDFYKDAHRQVYGAMCLMMERGQHIDAVTLADELAKHGRLDEVGGRQYLDAIITSANGTAVEQYARIIKEKSSLRKLILLGNRLVQASLDTPAEPDDILAEAERQIYGLRIERADREFTSLRRLVQDNVAPLESAMGGRPMVTGIPTGFTRFDETMGGYQKQDFIIVGARPSMGKTSFMLNSAAAMSILGGKGGYRIANDRQYKVGIFSLEMTEAQIFLRLLSAEAGVPSVFIRAGIVSEKQARDILDAMARMQKGHIYIDDTMNVDIGTLCAKARRLKQEADIDILMIDYLQLMEMKGGMEQRNDEMSQVSRSLKHLARSLDIPVMAVSQLTRKPEERARDHRPRLADLRDSGSLEQDADIVTFIYRDEVYHRDTEEKGIAEIIVAKQRNGPTDTFKLVFRNDITRFFDYAPEPDFCPDPGNLPQGRTPLFDL